MSVNLYLQDGPDGPETDLWQTPTHITNMCLSINPADGEPDGGHEAVRRRYLHWVDSELNGVYQSEEDMNWLRKKIADHKSEVLSVKNPHFYCI